VNTPFCQPTSEDAGRPPFQSALLTQEFSTEDALEEVHGADSGRAPAAGPQSCGSLLGEFLALMGRIEADFTRRSELARLAEPMSAHRQGSQHGWAQSV
jgi:hypothetical protein